MSEVAIAFFAAILSVCTFIQINDKKMDVNNYNNVLNDYHSQRNLQYLVLWEEYSRKEASWVGEEDMTEGAVR